MPRDLPCPPLPFVVEMPDDPASAIDGLALPARPGVLVLEHTDGRTVAIFLTADLRRLARSRLDPVTEDEGPSRRVDYRAVTRRARAVTVGSRFEADWAYLQLARSRLPATYRTLLDRWQAWFVHGDAEAAFPRWVKTARPGRPPTGRSGVHLGPMPDKHAAARYMDTLDATFDLCRYHHILTEAPRGAACAYKEMGRCPAPCDGTISMDAYRAQVAAALAFATTPFAAWREATTEAMRAASAALDFETAERLKRRLDDAAPADRPAYRHVDRLERFRFLAVMPGETPGRARLFLVLGGWIAPLLDADVPADRAGVDEVAAAVRDAVARRPVDLGDDALENLGLVTRHLFAPPRTRGAGRLLRLDDDGAGRRELASALGAIARRGQEDPAEAVAEESIGE